MCSHSFKIRRLSLLPAVTDTESLLSQAFIGRSFTWGRGVLTFYLHITPGSSAGKRICLQCRRPQFDSWVGKFPWRRDRLPTPVFLGFPGGSDGKESTCNARDLGLIPGFRRSPGGRHGNPLQYSCLEKIPMDRGAWWATVHGVAKSQTPLSD